MSGINMHDEKSYTCKVCKEKFMMAKWLYSQRSMKKVFKAVCQSKSCEDIAVQKMYEKVDAKMSSNRKKRFSKDRENNKGITGWKNDLQVPINWIVKQLDKDYRCVSHPNMKGFLRYDAGHYFTVKAHGLIRFNMHNIHKQNSQANEKYGGDSNYALGIKNRYGSEYLEMMVGLPLRWESEVLDKITIPNIKEIYLPKARQIAKSIKEEDQIWTRDEINNYIGIYK